MMDKENSFGKFPFMLIILFSIFFGFAMCKSPESADEQENTLSQAGVQHPEWAKDAVIYELNVRQYSEEGSFNAITADMGRLKELGIDIIWLMPVHPIGEVNRKGELGSYYSVKDYRAVNPEFGTMEDFKTMVNTAHENEIKVIIDWVPNHSAWDNPLAEEHPDWYVLDEDGNFTSPFDWTDVIQFDYDNEELRQYMIESLKFWVEEANIDGYRFDVAHMVPVDFWDEVRPKLREVKEVFLLAEADQPWLHENAMDMSYDWKFHHIMNEVAVGKQTVVDIKNHFAYVDTAYPPNSILMQFTSNHDENSWQGTVYDRLGDGVKTFAALTYTIPGMPLIYNGQEACMDKMLEFFQRDPIKWKDCELFDFYQSLNDLRTNNPALWSGNEGGNIQMYDTDHEEKVFAFGRVKEDNKIVAIFNFSDEDINVKLPENIGGDGFIDYFTNEELKNLSGYEINLTPWDFKIFID